MVVAGKMVIDQAKQADTKEQGAYKYMNTVKASSQTSGNRGKAGSCLLSMLSLSVTTWNQLHMPQPELCFPSPSVLPAGFM